MATGEVQVQNASRPSSSFEKAITGCFVLYLVSLLTTLAGCEGFGWILFTLTLVYAVLNKNQDSSGAKIFFSLGADKPFVALCTIVFIGYFFSAASDANFWKIVGGMRWGLLMYAIAAAFRMTRVSEKVFIPLMTVATIVALHGIQMYFSGWDFIRNRPAHYFVSEGGHARACGFFTMPTNFAHAANMTMCFPVAALLLKWSSSQRVRAFLLLTTALLGLAVYLSFTRGAWIALFFALTVLAALVNKKLAVVGVFSVLAAAGGLYLTNKSMQDRAATLVNPDFASNAERLDLWRANVQMFKEYPIFGLGLNDNERRSEEYNAKVGNKLNKVGNAHNTYLQFLSGTGLLGLVAYLAFMGFYFLLSFRLWKLVPADRIWHRTLILGAIGAQVAMHLGGLTDCNFKNLHVNHQFITILALLSYLRFVYIKPANDAPKPISPHIGGP